MSKKKAQTRDHRMEQYMDKYSFKKLSPINSDVDLAIYRAYTYVLKHEIPPRIPVREVYMISSSYANIADITFRVLRDMGVKFVCSNI